MSTTWPRVTVPASPSARPTTLAKSASLQWTAVAVLRECIWMTKGSVYNHRNVLAMTKTPSSMLEKLTPKTAPNGKYTVYWWYMTWCYTELFYIQGSRVTHNISYWALTEIIDGKLISHLLNVMCVERLRDQFYLTHEKWLTLFQNLSWLWVVVLDFYKQVIFLKVGVCSKVGLYFHWSGGTTKLASHTHVHTLHLPFSFT